MALYERYHRPSQILLTALGLWPYNDSIFQPVQKIFFTLLLGFSICLQIGKIITSVTDMDSLFGILWFAVPCLAFSLKYATFCIKAKDIRTLMELLKQDWNTIKRKEEVEILKQYTNIAYMITIFAITFYYFAIFGFIMEQLLPKILDVVMPLNESRPAKLLGLATYFFDEKKYYFPILLHMTMALSAEAATMLATETMSLFLLQHVCGLFKIVRFRIQHAFDCDLHIPLSQKNRIYHANIVDIVIMHNKAIKFFYFLNACFEASYFTLYWLGICSLTINMFRVGIMLIVIHKYYVEDARNIPMEHNLHVYMRAKLIEEFIVYCTCIDCIHNCCPYVISQILYKFINCMSFLQAAVNKEIQQIIASGIFIFCHFVCILLMHFLPEFATNYSDDLFYEVCNLPWYSVPVQLQKTLQILMYRTMKSCKFSIYMLEVSLERFSSLLSLTLSYFTVFWSMRN